MLLIIGSANAHKQFLWFVLFFFLSLILSFHLVFSLLFVRSFWICCLLSLSHSNAHISYFLWLNFQHLAAPQKKTTTTTYRIIIQTNMWNVYNSIIFSSPLPYPFARQQNYCARLHSAICIFFCGSKCRGRMRWSLLTIIYTPWRKMAYTNTRAHTHTHTCVSIRTRICSNEQKKTHTPSTNAFVRSHPEFVIKLVSLLLKKNALTLMCAHGVWLHV